MADSTTIALSGGVSRRRIATSAAGSAPGAPPRISPAASPLQAAAIVAAIECFARDTAPAPPKPAAAGGGWLRAGRAEAVAQGTGSPRRPFADPAELNPRNMVGFR
jgi:hypothetical protein